MSHPPNRASDSAVIQPSDSRLTVSKSEIAKISTKLMQGIIDHQQSLVRLVEEMDNLVDKAIRLVLEIRGSENPSSDAIQLLHDMIHTIESTGRQFNAMLCMDADKWSKMAELLDVECQ